jgi:hypothetical protein
MDAAASGTAHNAAQKTDFQPCLTVEPRFMKAPPLRADWAHAISNKVSTARVAATRRLVTGAFQDREAGIFRIGGVGEEELTLVKRAAAGGPDGAGMCAVFAQAYIRLTPGTFAGIHALF